MLKTKIKQSRVCSCGKFVFARDLCKNCYDKWLKNNNPQYLQRQLENSVRWHQRNVEHVKATDKAWRAKRDPEYVKAYKRKKTLERYGLTPESYDVLLETQNGVCAICERESTRSLAVDHNHSTGVIRGLLCFRCNFGLTYFSEDSKILQRASDYLAREKVVGDTNG